MRTAFICPSCQNEWSMKSDKYGLFDGYGNPPCPVCGDNGGDANDYGDFVCPACNHKWRNYGNGGLVFGTWPNCPNCGMQASSA